ncbi:hypothetical protein AB0I60_02660 [Actinosynnema sp. NPDC050436]|uniref:hypothetical protein n=1 Tax=Actinosynnema sp. NPDC050436 TaxID=3155659 RepID=UPI0033FC69CD
MINKIRAKVGIAAVAAAIVGGTLMGGAAATAVPGGEQAAPVAASANAAGQLVELTTSGQSRTSAAGAALPCGAYSEPASGGGWNLYWTNCWSNYTHHIAPLWYADIRGNKWVNVLACHSKVLKNGETASWYAPSASFPPADAKASYLDVVFCI